MTRDERIERALDAALESTFPASDPIPFYGDDAGSRSEDARRQPIDGTSSI